MTARILPSEATPEFQALWCSDMPNPELAETLGVSTAALQKVKRDLRLFARPVARMRGQALFDGVQFDRRTVRGVLVPDAVLRDALAGAVTVDAAAAAIGAKSADFAAFLKFIRTADGDEPAALQAGHPFSALDYGVFAREWGSDTPSRQLAQKYGVAHATISAWGTRLGFMSRAQSQRTGQAVKDGPRLAAPVPEYPVPDQVLRDFWVSDRDTVELAEEYGVTVPSLRARAQVLGLGGRRSARVKKVVLRAPKAPLRAAPSTPAAPKVPGFTPARDEILRDRGGTYAARAKMAQAWGLPETRVLQRWHALRATGART